ncbi:MAG: hypothetical protein QOH31_6020 [Verrucomicrobiota bacterium]
MGPVGCRVTQLSDPPLLLVLFPFPVQIARVKNSLPKHLVLLVALLGCASGASAIANVRVEFVKPENYTDVSFRSMTPESARERLIGELALTIKDGAAKPLSGYDLYVRILDVHMAGRPAFEAPGINSDLRIRNRTTPPKISLQYVVKDRSGKVVAKGSEFLIDPNYQWNVSYEGTDELYSEKALLRSWILSLPQKINRS